MDNCSNATLYPGNPWWPRKFCAKLSNNIDKMRPFCGTFAAPPDPRLTPVSGLIRQYLVDGCDPFVVPTHGKASPPQASAGDVEPAEALPEMRCFNAASDAKADIGSPPRRYLPIELLRERDATVFRGQDDVRTFQSSGTTDQQRRSQSHFSTAGLELYRAASVATFFHVLGRVAATPTPQTLMGLSLVPPPGVWPDSSLAQMVAWLGERAPVAYCDESSFAAALAKAGTAPLWVFGTAFHLLNLIDAGAARRLPAGSFVIETGGTKGKAREVSRAELYREISAAFAVPQSAIVSEYGMCELASQAYDWVEPGATTATRRFRFPAWVRPLVFTAPKRAATAGEGFSRSTTRSVSIIPGRCARKISRRSPPTAALFCAAACRQRRSKVARCAPKPSLCP